MLYKKILNSTGGEYRDKTTLERCDLITAEIRFYCPVVCVTVCGEAGSCCFVTNSKEEAITHFNLVKYE
jgi:hypothetical protein